MKYPIILVHGIMIKDFKFIKAFGRIEKILKDNNYACYTADTDGFGTIENNALQLKKFIEQVLIKEKVDKVNIIAHSKGGLDTKYMISKLDMKDKVASFTSLCTPFKGSPIASLLLKLPKFITKIMGWYVDLIYRIFKDKNPSSLKVCHQLKKIDNIEDECLDIKESVYCQSYSTTLKKRRDDFVMGIPLTFSKFVTKSETDGLVEEDSTIFGNYRGKAIDGSISHTEIIDFFVKKKKRNKIHSFYLSLCLDLENKGF